MAFSKGLIKVYHTNKGSDVPKKTTTRTKKADRPLDPPHIDVELRQSRYGLADRLLEHFSRWRNDRDYAREFGMFFRSEQRRKFEEAEKLEAWLDKKRAEEAAAEAQTGVQERFYRVRASELKSCSRSQAMRLMGFAPADI